MGQSLFPYAANGSNEGVTKLLFDDSPKAHGHGKILGGGMVGTHADDMIGEIAIAIAIEMGADAVDIPQMFDHIVVGSEPPRLAPGRGPPL